MSVPKASYTIKPSVLCKTSADGVDRVGECPFDVLKNLSLELRKQGVGSVHYRLHFYQDSDNIMVVEGEIWADFEWNCQRCLQSMIARVTANVLVSPVSSYAEANRLPTQYEPLLMDSGEVNLWEWIAEELHLALPLVARHETPCVGE